MLFNDSSFNKLQYFKDGNNSSSTYHNCHTCNTEYLCVYVCGRVCLPVCVCLCVRKRKGSGYGVMTRSRGDVLWPNSR